MHTALTKSLWSASLTSCMRYIRQCSNRSLDIIILNQTWAVAASLALGALLCECYGTTMITTTLARRMFKPRTWVYEQLTHSAIRWQRLKLCFLASIQGAK
jgi:hypothetical protein